MGISYDKTIKRIATAEANKALWHSILDDCYDYFLPTRNVMDYRSPGQQKDEKVFDSTATDSLGDFASRMEAQLVPPGREWMKLAAGSDIPEEQKDQIETQLEKMTETVFSHINSSNFSSQINECFLDLGISTGAIIVEEGDGIQSSLRFRAVPLAHLILERSIRGIAETVWQRIKLPASDIAGIFPHIKMTDELNRMVKDKPETEVEFIEGVMLNPDERTYTSMILYEKDKSILFEEQLESSPWVIFRESTTPGEVYGRGRAMRCLNDVRTLNKVMQYYIESCELNGNPIYTAVDDGVINPHTIKIRPKTIIPVAAADTINPLPMAGAPELSIDLINRLQDNIRRVMMSKPFGQIDETPVRTATEMSIRNADLAETTASASGRIQTELLERLIARCVFVLKTAGKVPDIRVDGREIAVKYTSPAARKQDEADLSIIMRFQEIMQMFPPDLVATTVKMDDVPRYIANMMGVDKNLIMTAEETQNKTMEIQQNRAAMQEQEMMQQGAPSGIQQ